MAPFFSQASLFPVQSILLFGPTGVGKTPLGNAMAEQGLFGRRCHHFDFGSELRTAVSNNGLYDSYTFDERAFIQGVLERGLLLENEHFHLAEKILSLFLSRNKFSSHDILVLNGIPRHAGQAENIAAAVHIHALIVLDCSSDAVYGRISDNAGGDRTGRVDDHRDMIRKKLLIFRHRTEPLIAFYEKRDCSVYRIYVTDTMIPEDVYRVVSSLTAVHPPLPFVAEPPER